MLPLHVGVQKKRGAFVVCAALALSFASPPPASAVPGPATTAVIANANVAASVALAERYARERNVPRGQVCLLPIDDVTNLGLDAYRGQVLTPFEACLDAAGARDRVEAVLLVRGVPLRVEIPDGARTRRVSLAAALGLWQTTTASGEPLLGQAPGTVADCGGTACYAAGFRNVFRVGVFSPGYEREAAGITFRPLLVTMLHGYSHAEAEMLLDSALMAEAMGGADGEFLFMDGRDSARGVLDAQYPGVISDLMERGYTDAREVAFEADTTGHTFAAFFTGTATIGTTIEGNDFHPGALVDNLTSFGAVPENFTDPSMERQVSVSRWVARGVAGVHGTTDEPLNSVFPHRALITQYVDGATLAEAYHRNLPNVYWHNLVLGDPMAAPYAVRPEVDISGVTDGDTVSDARSITVSATDREGFGVDALWLYQDGVLVAEAAGDALEYCVSLDAGETASLLAVAQKRDDLSDRGLHRPKGWTALTVTGTAGAAACTAEDAGLPDSGAPGPDGSAPDADAGPPPPPISDDGCGCNAPGLGSGNVPARSAVIALLLAFGLRRRRRRPRGWSSGP